LPILTADEARRDPSVTAFTRSFSFLEALGFAAGLLAVAGLLLYLQVRQRSRALSYALSRRMGLARTSQSLSLALELGAMLLAAFVVATVVSLAVARLVLTRIEPLASISPVPLFSAPVALLGATFFALLAAIVAGAWLATRSAEKENVAEVLRLEA
jgi:ABC-type antimicrobial peptide transport system permease subunit